MSNRKSIKLLTMNQVLKVTGFKSRTTIYNRIKKNCFPPACSIGLGRVRWREQDIAHWADGLPYNLSDETKHVQE